MNVNKLKNLVSLTTKKLQTLSHASDPRVLADMLEKQYQEFYLNILGTATVTLLFLLAIPGAVNNPQVWTWCIAQWALGLIHFFQCKRFLKASQVHRDYELWYFRALVIMFLSGLLWGLAPFAFFTIGYEVNAVVITGTAALILAGGLALVHLPGGYVAFGITAMSLLVLAMFSLTSDWYLIAYMGILGLVIMLKFSLNTNQSVADAISLRFKNADLVKELERANIAKSKFLATASHDLRQPLQALSLLTTAANEHGNANAATLNSMQRSVQNLNVLFNSLLDISKLDAGVIVANPQNVHLSWLLDYIFNQFKEMAMHKDLDYQLFCEPDIWVKTDPILTQRILINIIDNAFNNTESGLIHIKAYKRKQVIIINIEDTGHGIAEDKLDKIFTEFYQLKNQSGQHKKGMGLGLSIVKHLAELQNHAITFTSQLKVGSTFSITLPSTAALEIIEASANDLDAFAEQSQFKILVVENEKDIGTASKVLLEAWGHTVLIAENSAQAMALTSDSSRQIDLIISDFQLGENTNGLDLCLALQEATGIEVPCIIITGNTDPDTIKLMASNSMTLLHKPIFPPQLRLSIENLLKEH